MESLQKGYREEAFMVIADDVLTPKIIGKVGNWETNNLLVWKYASYCFL